MGNAFEGKKIIAWLGYEQSFLQILENRFTNRTS